MARIRQREITLSQSFDIEGDKGNTTVLIVVLSTTKMVLESKYGLAEYNKNNPSSSEDRSKIPPVK